MKYNNDFTEFAGLKGKEALVLDQWLDQYQLKQDLMSQDESHTEDSQVPRKARRPSRSRCWKTS